MDQLILPFLILCILVLSFVIVLILRARKGDNNSVGASDHASLLKELELKNQAFLKLEERLQEEKNELSLKEEKFRLIDNNYTKSIADLENLHNNLRKEQETVLELKNKIEIHVVAINHEKEEKSKLQALLKVQDERIENQKKEVESIQERFTEQFEILANKILEEKTEKFTQVNKERLDQILSPLTKNLKEFEGIVRETYQKEGRERHSLSEEVKNLMNLNKAISQETKDLTEALKGSSKQQGDWGETVLENILEQSGMTKGREYFLQESLRDDSGAVIKNEEGKTMRPDVIVQYPDKRKVIIDSKVSLTAYVEFSSSSKEEEQERAIKKHMISIKKHIDELSAKSYPEYGSDLDFVMMFVPIEGAYVAAMQANPNLWNDAYKKNVLLISPTNLIAALRLIVDMWERDKQSKNAEEIALRGGKLYEKFVGFLSSLEDIGSSLKKSQRSYENALGQLSDGRGNLVSQAKHLEKLGIKYNKSKQIPTEFLKDSDNDINLIDE